MKTTTRRKVTYSIYSPTTGMLMHAMDRDGVSEMFRTANPQPFIVMRNAAGNIVHCEVSATGAVTVVSNGRERSILESRLKRLCKDNGFGPVTA